MLCKNHHAKGKIANFSNYFMFLMYMVEDVMNAHTHLKNIFFPTCSWIFYDYRDDFKGWIGKGGFIKMKLNGILNFSTYSE